MHPIARQARVAGALYVSLLFLGPFSLIYVPNKLIVRGNATATAANVLAHETLFRAGIVVDLIGTVAFIFVALALYRLLSRVNAAYATQMVILALVSAVIDFANLLNNIAALILFKGADFLAVFDAPQRNALAMLFLRLHTHGIFIDEMFWGLWLIPLGVLVMRSGFVPKILGVLLLVNALTWMALSVTALLLPEYSAAVNRYAAIPETGELWFMLWLLIMGAKVEPSAPALAVAPA
jgi:hypothetical protein